MKKTLLILCLLALAGCANLKFQWAASYQTDNLTADLKADRQAVDARAAVPVPVTVPAQTGTHDAAKP